MSAREIQRETITDDDLVPYRGQWVAIRARHVVASALDPEELVKRPGGEDDFLFLVPTNSEGVYLL